MATARVRKGQLSSETRATRGHGTHEGSRQREATRPRGLGAGPEDERPTPRAVRSYHKPHRTPKEVTSKHERGRPTRAQKARDADGPSKEEGIKGDPRRARQAHSSPQRAEGHRTAKDRHTPRSKKKEKPPFFFSLWVLECVSSTIRMV